MNEAIKPAQITCIPAGMTNSAIWLDRTLPIGVKAIYGYLAHFRGMPSPTRNDIATDLGMSLNTLTKYVAIGETAGLFEVVRTVIDRACQPNRYRLRDDADYIPGVSPQLPPKLSPTAALYCELAKRDGGWKCTYCGDPLAPVGVESDPRSYLPPQADHVVARARGGSDALANRTLTCGSCNLRKGMLLLDELSPKWWEPTRRPAGWAAGEVLPA